MIFIHVHVYLINYYDIITLAITLISCRGWVGHDFVGTILTVGMYLVEMHLSQTHSAESSVVSRLYANSLIPVHCLELKYPTILKCRKL